MREKTLRRLIKIVEESNIESLEIPYFFRKIKITKKISPNGQGSASAVIVGAADPTGEQSTAPVSSSPPPTPQPSETKADNLVTVTSPMVGTFYRAPSPDADPFVEVGTRVNSGDTVCIIEAMKLMNEIEAEVAGVIKEIHIQNGEPLEYGQLLFSIDPHG